MRRQQILREEVLREIIEFDIVRSQAVCGSDATYTSELMHVLFHQAWASVIDAAFARRC